MDSQLTGQVVLITGAAGGIGAALTRKFAAEGARLVLHYRRSRREALALQGGLPGVHSIVVGADLTKEAEARRLLGEAAKHFGRVDTLVANAGSWESRDVPMHRMSLRQWEATLANVLTSTFLTVREFLRLVARQRRGNAVLISSTAGIFGEAGHADYASAKSAMAFGLTRSLKNEMARLAPHTRDYCGGRINCICPGWTVVPRTLPKLKDAAVVRKVIATMALPQLARPDDIANCAVFLASDALARHITGQVLVVAGGMEGRWLWQPGEVDPSLA
jgi:3-oxoacyl-[acyl-carrier protein] reductase